VPYIKGANGNTVEVAEGVLQGLLSDPDISEVDVNGKPVKVSAVVPSEPEE
jgi:hypothetical protein